METSPPVAHPKLLEIDDALTDLEPKLNAFALPRGFELLRGNRYPRSSPRRKLRRRPEIDLHQDIVIMVMANMFDQLERGIYAEIPCGLYVLAQSFVGESYRDLRSCSEFIVEHQPYTEFMTALPQHLAAADSKLEAWTLEFIAIHGQFSHSRR